MACGSVKEQIGTEVVCSEGLRTCSSGTWGDCVADHEEKKPLSFRAPMQGGFTPEGLGTPASCNSPCDPGCAQVNDDATGLTVDPDLSASSDGVTLPAGSAGGSCDNVTVTPNMSTVTITSIAVDGTIVATPNNGKVDLDATCSGGVAIEPSWTIDSYDRAVISAHGVVTVFSGVGGPIKATGATTTDSDTATVNVKVAVGDTLLADGTTTEVGKTLYPYNSTLFPLGLKAPLVQWTEGGITPTKVQVALCYPKDTCTTFQYAKTFPVAPATTPTEPRDGPLDATVPAWQIPQEIWSAFDLTAAGGTGQIVIRRVAGSTKYKPLKIDVKFATDALRGTVYYTQYLRSLHTSDAQQTFTYSGTTYTPGQTCQVGNNTHPSGTAGSQTRAIDLSTSAATNTDPFAKGGYTAGCPVCHSVSADGSTEVAGSQYWQTMGGNGLGINGIGLDATGAPAFGGLFAAPDYSVPSSSSGEGSGEDSRGFSYAAISPDGALVLQGPTFWGSTAGTPSANTVQNANLTGVSGFAKPYFFAPTDSPSPGAGVQFATTGPLATNTRTTNVLTATCVAGTCPGALSVDGETMATGYSVLVKNEGTSPTYNSTNNGIYTVTTVGNGSTAWKLTRRSDADSANEMAGNMEVRVTDGNLLRGKVYYISTPAGGNVTPNTTSIAFSERVYPPWVFGGTPHTADYATTDVLLPATVTQSGNTLTGGYTSSLTVDGHTMATGEKVLVKDQANPAQNGLYSLTTLGVGGTGAPVGVGYATTAALPANTNVSGVLTATAGGALPAIDGITPGSGDTILVKNEANQANNGIYTVTTVGVGGSGTPLTAALCATTGALPTNANAAGVLTPTGWGALGTIDGVTLAGGSRVLVKNEGTPANNGVYVVTSLGTGTSVVHTAAKLATIAPLPANTNTAGVLTATNYGVIGQIDGVTLTGGERVLVMSEGTPANNGLYTVTSIGTGTGTVHTAVRAATIASLQTNTATATTLTETNPGGLSIDGVTPFATGDRVLVKNEVTQTNNGLYAVTAAGTGTQVTHTAVRVATTGILPTNTATTTTLTASAFGGLTIDGQLLAGADRVLVKNEATGANNGLYAVTTAGGGTTVTHTAVKAASAAALPTNAYALGVITPTAYGALTIDGVTGFTAGDRVLLQDEGTTANNGIYTVTNAGTGITTTIPAVRLATAVALTPAGTRVGNVITAGSNGALSVDGVTVVAGDRILVKNETTTVNNGVYTVTTVGNGTTPWKLTRTTTDTLVGGIQIPVTAGATNINKTFYISSPGNNVAITPNTTVMTFTQSVKWSLTRALDVLVGGDQVPVSAGGTTNGGLQFYLSTPANGLAVTLGTTALAFTLSSKWVLTRVDTMLAGDQVPITAGPTNGGKTYYISTPAIGTAITPGTTALAFTISSGWVLTRVDTMAGGDQVPVTAGGTNAGLTYYISTPATGAITAGSVPVAFLLSSKWVLTRVDTLLAGDQVPVTNGGSNAGKTFYLSTPAVGTAITINVTPLAFSPSSKWALARASDATTSLQILPGLRVPVTSGGTNGGKTYYLSSPASGTIIVNSTPLTFSIEVAWQLTRKSPYDAAGNGLVPGLQVSAGGGTANANKTFYISSPTTGTITEDTTPIVFSAGSSWVLTRTTDADGAGDITPGMEVKVANGAVNAGRVFNVSSPTSGTITINTTPLTFSYGLPSMMAPVISPDGKKVAYVNGDADVGGGLAETGWRRGLSMFSFDQATMTVSSKKRLINNYSATSTGMAVKWPFFEGDSRSLLYVETDPNEYCSSGANNGTCSSVGTDTYAAASCTNSGGTSVNSNLERACFQAAYGSMSPTTRGFWPGKIYSIDTTNPSTTRVELSSLDDAEDPTDADKAYQPTVLPFTAGGKRWVIFTSPRAYGNQFNQKSSAGTPTDLSCAASMLWVSALDDTTANGTDRSHPGFFMPGQQVLKINATGNHYVNERGYLVPSPCKDTGNSCSVDEECCGSGASPATAACRAPTGWDPATGAPKKKCEALSGTCNNAGGSCSTSADCCSGASCVNLACSGGGHYEAATFTREYVATCASGQLPRWMLFSYHLNTPGDSNIAFSAQTSDDLGSLDAAKVVNLGTSTSDIVKPAAAETIDVGGKLDTANVSKNFANLRILMKLNPSTDGLAAPVIHDWNVTYTCESGL